MTTVIDVSDGAISLGGRPVLRGVDLSVRQGEVVALLGSNGSGKSTLVRGVLGLTPWVRGEVQLFGTPLRQFRAWERVGYVPQRPSAGSGVPATVTEVVASGLLARRRLLTPLRRAERARVREALDAVELSDRSHDAVAQLSGGQQQRVLIARALAGRPDLYVLDEPTAGVDHHNQVRLAQLLRTLVESGTTVLFVLHELGPMADLIDRAVLLQDGRVTYDGPPPEESELEAFHTHHHAQPKPDTVPMESGWQL
jgi:zinc transport system ATP-binding protein